MSHELGDPDDRCCDEGREADVADREADECLQDYGVPFDPYADEEDE
jgi:hypothetical protein